MIFFSNKITNYNFFSIATTITHSSTVYVFDNFILRPDEMRYGAFYCTFQLSINVLFKPPTGIY